MISGLMTDRYSVLTFSERVNLLKGVIKGQGRSELLDAVKHAGSSILNNTERKTTKRLPL